MSVYVLVSGDFSVWGGMDRANYELARYLAEDLGATVHLVGYLVASPLAEHPNIIWHQVRKPLNAYLLAEPWLRHKGKKVARSLRAECARVIVNGGNCAWPDVNWIHAVHAAWPNRVDHAPARFRWRAAALKARYRRDERNALQVARMVLTNSERARQQVISQLGLPPERVQAVYYGIDAEDFRPATEWERAAARMRLGWNAERPVAVFIGALGHDRNKGFDLLFAAWEQLCSDADWDVDLVALGVGAEVELWKARSQVAGLGDRIRMLGFSKGARDILAAADLLVSPTHYEAYGLGVHEALCCGLPAFVTRSAGIAERYPAELSELLLESPPTVADLVARMRRWHSDRDGYRDRVASFGAALRLRSWADMARDVVDLIN
ncbi:MAG: glycosyltransferase family 4 protein [Pyrinomonadaceae bacterium]